MSSSLPDADLQAEDRAKRTWDNRCLIAVLAANPPWFMALAPYLGMLAVQQIIRVGKAIGHGPSPGGPQSELVPDWVVLVFLLGGLSVIFLNFPYMALWRRAALSEQFPHVVWVVTHLGWALTLLTYRRTVLTSVVTVLVVAVALLWSLRGRWLPSGRDALIGVLWVAGCWLVARPVLEGLLELLR